VVIFTPRPLYHQQKTPVPTGKEAGWVPEPVCTWRQRDMFPVPPKNRTLVVQPVASLRLTKHHATKTYGSGGIDPRILNLGTRWRWVVCFTPRPSYPRRKIGRYPLDRKLGGPQSRSGRGGEGKNSQPLPDIEPHD